MAKNPDGGIRLVRPDPLRLVRRPAGGLRPEDGAALRRPARCRLRLLPALRRARLIDSYMEKVEELVERSHGMIRAHVVHERLQAMGSSGNEQTTRRAVAAAKVAYRAGRRRTYRPWLPEPGMWLQFDWGDSPRVSGRRTYLFCAFQAELADLQERLLAQLARPVSGARQPTWPAAPPSSSRVRRPLHLPARARIASHQLDGGTGAPTSGAQPEGLGWEPDLDGSQSSGGADERHTYHSPAAQEPRHHPRRPPPRSRISGSPRAAATRCTWLSTLNKCCAWLAWSRYRVVVPSSRAQPGSPSRHAT